MRSHQLIVSSVIAFIAGTASAVLLPEAERAQSLTQALFTSGWSVGPQVSLLHYEEPGLMEEDGILYGVAFSSTTFMDTSPSRNQLLRFEGSVAAGKVDYDGQLMDETPYTVDGNKDVLANVRLLWGCLWRGEDYSNQIYFGGGYRYLGDDSSHDPAGYKRHSNYIYLPVGYKRGQRVGQDWYLGLGAEFDLLLYGFQRSELFGDGYRPIRNRQDFGSGYGIRGTVALRHTGKVLDMSLEPFVQYWWVDDSDLDYGFYEPENNSTQIGVDVIFHF